MMMRPDGPRRGKGKDWVLQGGSPVRVKLGPNRWRLREQVLNSIVYMLVYEIQ